MHKLSDSTGTWRVSNGALIPEPVEHPKRTALISVAVMLGIVFSLVLIVFAVMNVLSEEANAEKVSAESASQGGVDGISVMGVIKNPSLFFDKRSKVEAAKSILEKWGVSGSADDGNSGGSIKKIASKAGFKQYYGPLDMKTVKGIGYPVIFEVKEGEGTGHVPVVGVWGKHFITDIEAGNHVAKEWVFERWTGNVYILWKNYKGFNRIMKRGSRGESVRWLHDCLASLGYANLGSNGYYGRITERAVLRFQSNNGLSGAGEAGPLTLMLLYKYLPEYETPGIVFDLG